MVSSFVSLSTPQITEGAADAEIIGFAWSSNIGWISFDGTNYGVSIDQQAGTLSGYAWSSNIGWISFNQSDLIGCPSNPCAAQLTGNAFSGWAKALSADGNGWDGWIHISGAGYGLTLDTDDTIDGYMWGGEVVGWVKSVSLSTDFENTCENGIDDDSDGLIDDADNDCDDPPEVEDDPDPQCDNDYDDDADGAIDYGSDIGCSSLIDNSEINTVAETPEVEVKVGIGSPVFDSLNIGKGGDTVLIGISVTHATTTTTCARNIITSLGNTQTSLPTGGAATYSTQQSLGVIRATKVIVTCQTGSLSGSDSIDIVIKDENEF